MKRSIQYYSDFLSDAFLEHLQGQSVPVEGIEGLREVGVGGGLETRESLAFLCELYSALEKDLNLVLSQRNKDRKFIDERTKSCAVFNKEWKRDFLLPDYQTVLGLKDADDRIVIGPKNKNFHLPGGKKVAPIPEFLQGQHVTLFGPPDSAKLCVNAMNAYHRKLKNGPAIVEELLSTHQHLPKWGADDEDSKTPLRKDLVSAGENLTKCFDGSLAFVDEETGKTYQLNKSHQSLPIKRFPGLALPSFFLFYKNNPLPLHLYDFALHLFQNWHNPKALVFYVPKLENEEEARYIKLMLQTAEEMIQKINPTYQVGTIRLLIVLENPRAIFRTHEIMDELFPYFAGASLGWHDYLASTARIFKEDKNYRIPVKADPDIVIKYIKASHDLLANVVGTRGGIKVGGMYGILPTSNDLMSPSFQVTIKGYIRDVITQLKRDLTGFWVAHPDFIRLGLALMEAWKFHQEGDSSKLNTLVKELLQPQHHQEIFDFIYGPDYEGLNVNDPMYSRSLIVADIKESSYVANNDPEEIRYNVFQSLQYLTDWLSGNGCVALPTQIAGVPVRVMDDLATAERSRWEVWHEIYHGRFPLEDFLKIAHEELHFIRKDKSDDKKIVQVKWDERTHKWYPVAFNLMIKLMTDPQPVEFATQLLMPFTIDTIRNETDPWKAVLNIDRDKYKIEDKILRFNYYFEMCGSIKFAKRFSQNTAIELDEIKKFIMNFDKSDIIESAAFHGNIGESKKTLDKLAAKEQEKVTNDDDVIKAELLSKGREYSHKFGIKFLVSAQGKSAQEILKILEQRLLHNELQELENAKIALAEITQKRIKAYPLNHLYEDIENCFKKHKINSAQITILNGNHNQQDLAFGDAHLETRFELASLSKSVASAFAIEFFKNKNIPLSTPVDELLAKTKSNFRLNDSRVLLSHLMNHGALNMHYVNGVPLHQKMPPIRNFLEGNEAYGYVPIKVINIPGEKFQYSGGGFLVLEHLIEAIEEKSIFDQTKVFLDKLQMGQFSFRQDSLPETDYAQGYNDQGNLVEGTRKMFPAFAAGAMGTSSSVALFLRHLERAYHHLDSLGPISHQTANEMLFGTDKGCMKFMGAHMGLGVFIATAGHNKFAIHQGANDGFRCLYLYCFNGPDQGKGLVTLCNAEFKGVLFNAEVTQLILKQLGIQGIDFSKFKTHFNFKDIAQEEVVNIGYKNLIFDAFLAQRPEEIIIKGPLDPLAKYNKLVGAKIIEVTNELFARADNLISEFLPTFDPELFGTQGKIMDSWETVRHNLSGVDSLTLELKNPSSFSYIQISTQYHTGNFSPSIKIEGLANEKNHWIEFLPLTPLQGHSELKFKLENPTQVFIKIRISMFPDGGLTRLGLYQDLPETMKKDFLEYSKKQSKVFSVKVPQTKKPLFINYTPDQEEIEKNWKTIKAQEEFNNASIAIGASIVQASDEHYGPAHLVISPFGPINMFDGMESSRSRKPGHFEEVIVKMAKIMPLKRIEIDFTYFINNNPLDLSIDGLSENEWIMLVNKTKVKPYAGRKIAFYLSEKTPIEQIRLRAHPCGGMNRIRAISIKEIENSKN